MILERIPESRYSRVLPLWKDRVAVILAGGPSLTGDLFKAARRARQADRIRAIAINDSFLMAPWADVHYAADAKWHRWMEEGVDKPAIGLGATEVARRWRAFPGQRSSIQSQEKHLSDDIHILQNDYRERFGLSTDPTRIFTGRHGGFQALNIATLSAARTVLLIGIDARRGENGEAHWHGEHPVRSSDAVFQEMKRSFSAAETVIQELGVRVINCSLNSAIDTFPKMSFADALLEVGA